MMAVSKRIRYEVLRRDNFTCRYCRSIENGSQHGLLAEDADGP